MINDYEELQIEHKVYADTIMEIASLFSIIANKHSDIIDDNDRLSTLFKTCVNKNSKCSHILTDIGNRYLTENKIDENKIGDTPYLLNITYAYQNLAEDIMELLNNDLSELNNGLPESPIKNIIDKLNQTCEEL